MKIERTLIGIFGKMNAGKSTLMNLITQQNTSIVDPTPGTTADVKIALIELHQIGPVKLFDTPGLDEPKQLGEKKFLTALSTLKEIDIALLIIRLQKKIPNLEKEQQAINLLKERKKQFFLIYNLEEGAKQSLIIHCNEFLKYQRPFLATNLSLPSSKKGVISFIEKNCSPVQDSLEQYLPKLSNDGIVFLNIPMDAESPTKRLLRPQELIQEYYLRNFVSTFCFRLDLQKARSSIPEIQQEEHTRFLRTLRRLNLKRNKDLFITDSQAIDVIHPWTLDKKGNPLIDFTTFSILMMNIKSKGRLQIFIDGLSAFSSLKKGDSILIAEACNHNRIEEDIGTVQIPKKIIRRFGKDTIHIDHIFGRSFDDIDLKQYKMVIHCGSCMIDAQKLNRRIEDLLQERCSITNYGLALAYLEDPLIVKRIVAPLQMESRFLNTEI